MKRYLYEVIAIATSILVAIQVYFVALGVYGDPYINRAEGASGICPIFLDAQNNWFYRCADEAQRQAAANVVADTYRLNATSVALLSLAACLSLFWGLDRLFKKRAAARAAA